MCHLENQHVYLFLYLLGYAFISLVMLSFLYHVSDSCSSPSLSNHWYKPLSSNIIKQVISGGH